MRSRATSTIARIVSSKDRTDQNKEHYLPEGDVVGALLRPKVHISKTVQSHAPTISSRVFHPAKYMAKVLVSEAVSATHERACEDGRVDKNEGESQRMRLPYPRPCCCLMLLGGLDHIEGHLHDLVAADHAVVLHGDDGEGDAGVLEDRLELGLLERDLGP